jgi:DNA-binding GntR family transcriptional regulator
MDDEIPSGLVALPRQSLRDQAVHALRSAIVLGQFTPGQHLSEVALSNSLGISRGTLREALRLIQQEGLAVEDQRGRLRVPELTADSIREIFQVREALETMAARLVVTHPRRDEAVAMLLKRVDDMADSRSGPILDQVDADLAFHRAWCVASGNTVLVETWDRLAGRVRMAILFAGPDQAMANMSPERHRELVTALRDGNAGGIAEQIHAHFDQALAVLLGELNSAGHGRS